MTSDFSLFLSAKYDEAFSKIWDFLVKVALKDPPSFSTILRFLLEAVKKSHKRSKVEFEVPEKKVVSVCQ